MTRPKTQEENTLIIAKKLATIERKDTVLPLAAAVCSCVCVRARVLCLSGGASMSFRAGVEENLRRLKGSHGQDEADEAGKAGTTAAEDSESGPAAAEEASAAVVAPKQTRETNPTNPAVEADGGVFL